MSSKHQAVAVLVLLVFLSVAPECPAGGEDTELAQRSTRNLVRMLAKGVDAKRQKVLRFLIAERESRRKHHLVSVSQRGAIVTMSFGKGQLAVAGTDGMCTVVNLSRTSSQIVGPADDMVVDLTLGSDDSTVLVHDLSGAASVWGLRPPRQLKIFKDHQSRGGSFLALGASQQLVVVGKRLRTYDKKLQFVRSLPVRTERTVADFRGTPDGAAVALGYEDGSVDLFDLVQWTFLRSKSVVIPHLEFVRPMPNAKVLAVGRTGGLGLWSPESGTTETLNLSVGVSCAAFQGASAYLGSEKGSVIAVDSTPMRRRWVAKAHKGRATALVATGQIIFSGGRDGLVVAIDADTGEVLGRVVQGSTPVTAMALSRAGDQLAVGRRDGTVVVRAIAGDVRSLEQLRETYK